MSVDRSMSPEGINGKKKAIGEKDQEKKPSSYRIEAETREAYSSFSVTQSPEHSFLLAKGTTKLSRRDDRGILCLLSSFFIFHNKTSAWLFTYQLKNVAIQADIIHFAD